MTRIGTPDASFLIRGRIVWELLMGPIVTQTMRLPGEKLRWHVDSAQGFGSKLYRKTALMFLSLSSFCMECTTSGFRKSIITNSSRFSP